MNPSDLTTGQIVLLLVIGGALGYLTLYALAQAALEFLREWRRSAPGVDWDFELHAEQAIEVTR